MQMKKKLLVFIITAASTLLFSCKNSTKEAEWKKFPNLEREAEKRRREAEAEEEKRKVNEEKRRVKEQERKAEDEKQNVKEEARAAAAKRGWLALLNWYIWHQLGY